MPANPIEPGDLLPYQAFSSLRHGHARRRNGAKASSTYQSWQAMKQRCNNVERDADAKHGGRGITYDQRWGLFDNFLADMGERPDGTTLDRRDNDGNYSLDNCQWSTPTQQARNRRNKRLDFDTAVAVAVRRLRGEPCKQIAKSCGISESLPREIVKGRTWPDALARAKEIIGGGNG